MTISKSGGRDDISPSTKNGHFGAKDLIKVTKLLPKLGMRGACHSTVRDAVLELLKTRLIIPVQHGSRDQAEIDEIDETVSALLTSRDWGGLARLIEILDQSRKATPSGIRHLEIASFYIRGHLSDFYEEPNAQNFEYAFGFSPETMSELHDACEAFPDSYALSALLARLHIDCGWAARGNADLSEMRAHFDVAHRLITRFDPVAYNSPFLAEIQYRLCIGIDNGHTRLGSAFMDWCDLDTSNMTIYRLHAFYCLPAWFGSADTALQEARAAYHHTKSKLGATAYSIMMLQAVTYDKSVLSGLDVDLCLRGFDDYLTSVESDSFRVTAMLRDIVAALNTPDPKACGPDASDKAISDQFVNGLGPVLRPHLSAYNAPAWPNAQDVFLEWASCAYLPELSKGDQVTLGPKGAEIRQVAA